MASTGGKRNNSQKRDANGEFAAKTKRRDQLKNRARALVPDVDFSSRNIKLGTAAVAGAAIAGALFAAWRSNAFADLFERDLIANRGGNDQPKAARDVIDDKDREKFAPATIPLRDSKYDRELSES
jgi:hypothetical protein